jgi:tryptophanyl-tRNA synthetase
VTDPKRIRRTDPGTPEVCNIYHLHRAFNPPETVANVAVQCRSAGWGCLDCKRVLFEGMERTLVPIRARAAELQAEPARVDGVLRQGAEAARTIAHATLTHVKRAMGLDAGVLP